MAFNQNPLARLVTFDQAVDRLIQLEGGYSYDIDGASKYGIHGPSHGMTDEQVSRLTIPQAKQIYKNKYWDAIDADHLPENMRFIALERSANFGVETALRMIRAAHNDPAQLVRLGAERHEFLASNNPDKYNETIRKGWETRDEMLMAYALASHAHTLAAGSFKAWNNLKNAMHELFTPDRSMAETIPQRPLVRAEPANPRPAV